ncbi:MAG: hypothetical protein ACFUZC_08610 [Chthoniobacteraceae bacterium]
MKPLQLLMLGVLLLPFPAHGGNWNTAIEDSFTVSAERPAESPLAGSSTEKGGRIWFARGNAALFQISPDGEVVNGKINGGKMVALVDCVPEGNYQIKVEADIQPGNAQWLGLGFSSGKDLFWSKETPGQLWLVITKAGQVQVYANATSKMLRTGKPTDFGFDPAKPTHAEIIYDRQANAVSVVLNGQTLLDGSPLGDFKPEIKTAGIMDNFPAISDPKMRVDNFKISVQNGTLAEPVVKTGSGKPAILIDSTAVKATNLSWGQPKKNASGVNVDLQAESSHTPFEPYYAEFAFDIRPEAAGMAFTNYKQAQQIL